MGLSAKNVRIRLARKSAYKNKKRETIGVAWSVAAITKAPDIIPQTTIDQFKEHFEMLTSASSLTLVPRAADAGRYVQGKELLTMRIIQ